MKNLIEKMISENQLEKALELIKILDEDPKEYLGQISPRCIKNGEGFILLKCLEDLEEKPEEEEIVFFKAFSENLVKNGNYEDCLRIENLIGENFLQLKDLSLMVEINFERKEIQPLFGIAQRLPEDEKTKLVKRVINDFSGSRFALSFVRLINSNSDLKAELEAKLSLAVLEGNLDQAQNMAILLKRSLTRVELEQILEVAIEKYSLKVINKILKSLDRKITLKELQKRFSYLIKNELSDNALELIFLFPDSKKGEITENFIKKFPTHKSLPLLIDFLPDERKYIIFSFINKKLGYASKLAEKFSSEKSPNLKKWETFRKINSMPEN
ncbi:MAG: putative phage abortive infection protein [Patescibacteria group bacterium]|jgi:hypothetical protein